MVARTGFGSGVHFGRKFTDACPGLAYFVLLVLLFLGLPSLGGWAAEVSLPDLSGDSNSSKTLDEVFIEELTGAFKKSIAYKKSDLTERQQSDVDYVNDSVIWTTLAGRKQRTNLPREELVETLYSRVLSQSKWQREYFLDTYGIMRSSVWEDLGLIATNATRPDQSLVNLLAEPKTILGQMQMGVLLVTPTTDINELKRRQKILSYLKGEGSDGHLKLSQWFAESDRQINQTVQFWNSADAYSERNSAVFRARSPFALLGNGAVPIEVVATFNKMSVLGVLALFGKTQTAQSVWGNGVSWLKNHTSYASSLNDHLNIGTWGRVLLPSLGVYRHITGTLPQLRIVNSIKERLRSVRDVVRLARLVQEFVKNDPVLAKELAYELAPIHRFLMAKQDPQLRRILKNLEAYSLREDVFFADSIFSRYGTAVETLILIINQKDKFADMLMALGRIDAYLAVAERFRNHEEDLENSENQSADSARLSFVEYETNSAAPHLALKGFWSPFLTSDAAVVNDVSLGGEGAARIGVFSGPNAGGKSTLMKAVGYNVLLAQTFGISFSTSMQLTPFANITTYMNITDDVLLGQSLFKAEVNRTKKYLDILRGLAPNEFSFSILDEVFSGTNPKEGAATAYSAIHHIGLHPQVLGMVATHYKRVTYLAERVKEKGIFRSFHVALKEDNQGHLEPDFKLYEGPTEQGGALLILKNEGFAPEILDEALEVLEN